MANSNYVYLKLFLIRQMYIINQYVLSLWLYLPNKITMIHALKRGLKSHLCLTLFSFKFHWKAMFSYYSPGIPTVHESILISLVFCTLVCGFQYKSFIPEQISGLLSCNTIRSTGWSAVISDFQAASFKMKGQIDLHPVVRETVCVLSAVSAAQQNQYKLVSYGYFHSHHDLCNAGLFQFPATYWLFLRLVLHVH